MNNELFAQAQIAYNSKDYETALAQFTECLQDSASALAPGESGLLYHQIGNSLIKLKDPNEAIHAYSQATLDSSYDAVGQVNYNLGMAYASLHDYEDAVKYFEVAVSDAKYVTQYKAYTGMGNALMKLGKSAEAGAAYRSAALDESNPDPTKALLNLGVCFMALNRPNDAIASYESALQFDMPAPTRNKMFANMGQAYVAAGKMNKAVSAFESALADKTYVFNDAANVDYQRAASAVAKGLSDNEELTPEEQQAQAASNADEPASEEPTNDMSGLDVSADGTPFSENKTEAIEPVTDEISDYYRDAELAHSKVDDGYLDTSDRFFNASDEELEKWSKGVVKQGRKRRNTGVKVFITFVILLLIIIGGALFAYSQGYGYPTQDSVTQQLFADPQGNKDEVFAADLSDSAVDGMLDAVVTDSSINIDGQNRDMTNSQVYVTAHTDNGGEVQYLVSLIRDNIGWKVSNVELYFASTN